MAGLWLSEVTTLDRLAYMEYLLRNDMSASNITNSITGIRSMFIVLGYNTKVFQDHRIPLFVKAIKITRPLQPSINLVLDFNMLEKIIFLCSKLQFSVVFRTLYSFCFFSFLRLSNVLPHLASTFDASRHLCRADLIFYHSKAVVILK